MKITTEEIKKLREQTGVSVMQCKKALEEAGGNMEKAEILLSKASKKFASKKAGRELKSGIVRTYIHSNNQIGTLVELLCETDFVAKNEEFISLADNIAMHITAMSPEYLNKEEITEDDRKKVADTFKEEIDAMDKPEDIKKKALEGKVEGYFAEKTLLNQAFIKNPEGYFAEKTLLNQAFIKNPETTIEQMIEEAIQKIGEKIEIGRFVRFEI